MTNDNGNVDGSSLPADLRPKSIGLVWGLVATTWCWVCIHQMNRVNSQNGFGRHDSTGTLLRERIQLYRYAGDLRMKRHCVTWWMLQLGRMVTAMRESRLSTTRTRRTRRFTVSGPTQPTQWRLWHRLMPGQVRRLLSPRPLSPCQVW